MTILPPLTDDHVRPDATQQLFGPADVNANYLACGLLHAIINREDGTVGTEVNPGKHLSQRARPSGHARSIELTDNYCADNDQTVSTGSGPLLPVSFDSKIEGRNALVTIHADRVEY